MAKHTSQSSLSSLTPTLIAGDERTGYGIPRILGPNGSDISLDLGNHGTRDLPNVFLKRCSFGCVDRIPAREDCGQFVSVQICKKESCAQPVEAWQFPILISHTALLSRGQHLRRHGSTASPRMMALHLYTWSPALAGTAARKSAVA